MMVSVRTEERGMQMEMAEMHVKPLQEYANLVRSYCSGVTSEQIVMIALSCQEEAKRGGNPSVWHNMAMVCKCKCHCAKCHPIKKAFSYKQVA